MLQISPVVKDPFGSTECFSESSCAIAGKQTLALVNSASGEWQEIGSFKHEQPDHYPGDVRCDLHPRWSSNGSVISVDSINDGKRGIYVCCTAELYAEAAVRIDEIEKF